MKKQITVTLAAIMMISSAAVALPAKFEKPGHEATREAEKRAKKANGSSAAGDSNSAEAEMQRYAVMAKVIKGFDKASSQNVDAKNIKSFVDIGEVKLKGKNENDQMVEAGTVNTRMLVTEAIKIVNQEGGPYNQLQVEAAKNALLLIATKEIDQNDPKSILAIKLLNAAIGAAKEMVPDAKVTDPEKQVVASDVQELSSRLLIVTGAESPEASKAIETLPKEQQKETEDCM